MNATTEERPVLTLVKKAPPTAQEMIAIEILRRIRIRQVPDGTEIDQITDNRMRLIAHALADMVRTRTGGNEDDFWKMYDNLTVDAPRLKDFRPLIAISPSPGTTEKPDPRFVTKDGKTLLKLSSIEDIYALPDASYLIAGILEAGAVSLLYGVSGTGKTFTSLDLGLHIVHGLLWHGNEVDQGDVWYINTEGGRGLKKRLKAWYIEHTGLKPSPNFRIIPWALDIREHHQILLDTLESLPKAPSLIVIDNFSMCAPGVNQNLQEEVAPVLGKINNIAQTFGSHVMVVHHTNKAGDVNGTMAFRNHVDNMIELKKEDTSNRFSPIIFSCQKSRDDEPFNDIRTELKSITVQIEDETLRPITSCVVVDCNQPEPEAQTPEDQKHAIEILHAHLKLTCTQWRKHCEEVHQIKRATFYRIRSVLEQEEMITTVGKGRGSFYTLTEKGVKAVG